VDSERAAAAMTLKGLWEVSISVLDRNMRRPTHQKALDYVGTTGCVESDKPFPNTRIPIYIVPRRHLQPDSVEQSTLAQW
jgi:hypothetical protein